jgi:hypothetical protein
METGLLELLCLSISAAFFGLSAVSTRLIERLEGMD